MYSLRNSVHSHHNNSYSKIRKVASDKKPDKPTDRIANMTKIAKDRVGRYKYLHNNWIL